MLLVSMVLMGVGMVWACRWLCVGKSVWCWGEVGCSSGEIRVVGPLFGVKSAMNSAMNSVGFF